MLLAIIVAASVLVGSTWPVFSHTWDEPEHLAAGLSLLDRFRYQYDIQHPPLGRLAMAVGPYLLGARSLGTPPPDGRPEGVAILYGEGHYHEFLIAARAGMLPFLWLLLLTTYAFARRVVNGRAQALLAVAVLAATPPILAHAGLATLDAAAVATTLLAIYAAMRWLEAPTVRSASLFGLANGVAIATKLSAIPFVGLALVTLSAIQWLCARIKGATPALGMGRWLAQFGLLTLVSIVVVTLTYGGRFEYWTDSTHRFNQALYYLFGLSGWPHDLAYAFAAHVPLPEAWRLLLGGVEALQVHNDNGHLSYLFGRTTLNGWWYFYLVALAVKTPLPLLGLGLVGLVRAASAGVARADPWRIAPLALFVVLLVFVSAISRINIGVRHVLVLYPLLAIGAAYALGELVAYGSRAALAGGRLRQRLACWLALVLLGWLAVGLALSYPDYLAYFNETVRNPEYVLVDSDLDWGQDLFRLERSLKARGIEQFSFGYLGTADLSREPLPSLSRLQPGSRASGWIAVSALARAYARGGYDWLNAYPIVERIGRTIDLYYVPPPVVAGAPGG